MSDNGPVRRRDLLTTAAFTMAGAGGLLALWPFVAAMGPSADKPRRATFDLSPLKAGQLVTLDVGGLPTMVFLRDEAQLAQVREFNIPKRERPPCPPRSDAFQFCEGRESKLPDGAQNWHRSVRADVMVCIGVCTRDGCVISRMRFPEDLFCPCCGSRYDLAGRLVGGPAPRSLTVPAYRFVNETTIEFLEAEVVTTPALRAGPA
jgi:ubiquinol-cytochrome c reductase iron-sulfur subunit